MSAKSFRLPVGTTPVNYDLFFEVDLDKFQYSTKETIDLEVKPTSADWEIIKSLV